MTRYTVPAVVAASAVAIIVLMIGPVLVGAYVEVLGFTARDAGLLFSLDMLGLFLGAVLLYLPFGGRCRSVAMVAVVLMVLGNALSGAASTVATLAVCRLLAGTGAGALMTLTMRVIGEMEDPDRVFGLWTCGQLALGATGLLVFPHLVGAYGLSGAFLTIAGLSALLFPLLRHFPERTGHATTRPGVAAGRGASRKGWLCLGGVFLYYSGQSGVWAYIERIGDAWALEPGFVANMLLAGLVSGIVGGAVAVILRDRAGSLRPVVMSVVLSGLAIALLITQGNGVRFGLASCLFNLGWYLFLPYSSALIARVDTGGALITGLAAIFPGSLAAGPALAALAMGGPEFTGALSIGLLSIPLGLACMWPAMRANTAWPSSPR